MQKRLEFEASKFWQIEQQGAALHIGWGKVGTNGQSQVKEFDSEDDAAAEAAKLIKEKLKKGYAEVASKASGKAEKPAAKTARTEKPAKKPAAKDKPAAKSKSCPLIIDPAATFADVLVELARFPAATAHELGNLARAEALLGHSARVAELCRKALASKESLQPWAIARDVAPAITALARGGGDEALVKALAAETFALVEQPGEDEGASNRQSRILVWLELGAALARHDAPHARKLVDEALTALPQPLEDQAVAAAARALLAIGEVTRAREVLRQRAFDVYGLLEDLARGGDVESVRTIVEANASTSSGQALLAAARKGHAAVVDALAPRLQSYELPMLAAAHGALAAHADPATWAASLTRAFGEDASAGTSFAAQLVEGVEARDPARLPALLDAVADALLKAPDAPSYAFWLCLTALARHGRDLEPFIARAKDASAELLRALSHAPAHREDVARLAAKVTRGSAQEFARVAAALTRSGHPEQAAGFLDRALDEAGSDRFRCVEVACELAEVSHAEGIWRALKQVSKARRINALEDLISTAGQRGHTGLVLGLLRTEPTLSSNAVYQATFGCGLFFTRAKLA